MRDVSAFASLAKALAFDRLVQNDCRLSLVLHGGPLGGVHFARIMTAAIHFAELIVAQMIDHLEQLGMSAKEMLANVAAGLDRTFLVFAVNRFLHTLEEQTFRVFLEKFIPVGPPNHLEDIP